MDRRKSANVFQSRALSVGILANVFGFIGSSENAYPEAIPVTKTSTLIWPQW